MSGPTMATEVDAGPTPGGGVRRRRAAAARRRGLRAAAATAGVVACAAGGFAMAAAPAAADACPNAQYRTGPSAALPDCRAYEMVSPLSKNGADIGHGPIDEATEALPAGGQVLYNSTSSFGNAPSDLLVNTFLGTRGPAGWGSSALGTPAVPTFAPCVCGVAGVSADFGRQYVTSTAALAPGAVSGNDNLYVHDSATGAYQLIANEVNNTVAGAYFAGAAADFSHVVFGSHNALQPQATPAPPSGVLEAYDWTGATLHTIGVLPDGTVDPNGAVPGNGQGEQGFHPLYDHPVSSDGRLVYWTEPSNSTSPIYLRRADTSTTAITVSQRGSSPSPTPQPGYFWAATRDGAYAYFTSNTKLTDQTSAANSADLYEYAASTGRLTDISVDGDPAASGGPGGVVGVGSSATGGRYVYFLDNRVLSASPNGRGQPATPGANNLYVWHSDGTTSTTTFIATVSVADTGNGLGGQQGGGAVEEVSPDGSHLAFLSGAPLTGYDNTDANTGNPDSEAFLYDAHRNVLACASCDPSGAPPTGSATLHQIGRGGGLALLAIEQNATDSGRLFFESPDELVAGDTNAVTDVYEFAESGAGGCGAASGCLNLISSGHSAAPSYFADASASGDDAFFVSTQPLTPQGGDNGYDLYDARVGGGYPAPAIPGPPCAGDGCHGAFAAAPPLPVIGTVTFAGPGNAGQAPRRARRSHAIVLTRAVRGPRFVVRVSVPGPGRVTITGPAVGTARRPCSRAGTIRLTVTLTGSARRTLHHRRRLRLALRIGYAPRTGAGAARTIHLTVRR